MTFYLIGVIICFILLEILIIMSPFKKSWCEAIANLFENTFIGEAYEAVNDEDNDDIPLIAFALVFTVVWLLLSLISIIVSLFWPIVFIVLFFILLFNIKKSKKSK